MKKILLGIIIGFVVIIGGCMALVGAGVSGVNTAIEEMETETAALDEKLQDMAKEMNWEVVKDEYSTNIVGYFENTSDETVDYIEFDYKLMDEEGAVIENSFTNATEIAPGEKRKIEIYCAEGDFADYEITVKSSAF